MEYQVCDLPQNLCGIYKITYPNGKIYIGQSVDIKRRMYEHNNTNRPNNIYPCDKAIKKYGKITKIKILEETSPDKLNEKEKYWINFYNSNDKNVGYNLTPGGNNLYGEQHPLSVFTNNQVLDIRKRRFIGERKCDVYKDYQEYSFNSFENVWLGCGYPNIGKEYFIPKNTITRQEYSSIANRGENNNKAKLTEQDVINIRQRYDSGEQPKNIFKDYPFVSEGTVRRVYKRKTWKHIK